MYLTDGIIMERKNKLDTEVVLTDGAESKQLTYDKLFWLFIAGTLCRIGVLDRY